MADRNQPVDRHGQVVQVRNNEHHVERPVARAEDLDANAQARAWQNRGQGSGRPALDAFGAAVANTPAGAPNHSNNDRNAKLAATSRVAGDQSPGMPPRARVEAPLSREDQHRRVGTHFDQRTTGQPLYQTANPRTAVNDDVDPWNRPNFQAPTEQPNHRPQHGRPGPTSTRIVEKIDFGDLDPENPGRPLNRAEIEQQQADIEEAMRLKRLADRSTLDQVGTAMNATRNANGILARSDERAWRLLSADPNAADALMPVIGSAEDLRQSLPGQSARERQQQRLQAVIEGKAPPEFPGLQAADRILDHGLELVEQHFERIDVARTVAAAFDNGTMNAEQIEKFRSVLEGQEVQVFKAAIVAREQQNKQLDKESAAITAGTYAIAGRTQGLVTKAISGPGMGIGIERGLRTMLPGGGSN